MIFWLLLLLLLGLLLSGNLAWLVRQVTELEVNMNAVERMVEWKDSREEAPAVLEPRPPTAWPHAGSIQVISIDAICSCALAAGCPAYSIYC